MTRLGVYFLVLLLLSMMAGCSGCSRSGRRAAATEKKRKGTTSIEVPEESPRLPGPTSEQPVGRSVIPLERVGGVDHVWVEINNHRFRFIFDTGASNICISSLEAMAMWKSGALSDQDVHELVSMQDATGRISEATRIVLRTVKIGDRTLYDVDALVLEDPSAPLLLGRTALDRFGRISMDNDRGVIILE